jgi:hypothetical protein
VGLLLFLSLRSTPPASFVPRWTFRSCCDGLGALVGLALMNAVTLGSLEPGQGAFTVWRKEGR